MSVAAWVALDEIKTLQDIIPICANYKVFMMIKDFGNRSNSMLQIIVMPVPPIVSVQDVPKKSTRTLNLILTGSKAN